MEGERQGLSVITAPVTIMLEQIIRVGAVEGAGGGWEKVEKGQNGQ